MAQPVSLSDFAGRKTIVYFYPAASTPGCTTQACDFRDNINSLKSAGYQVLGVSKDDLPALKKFQKEEGLNFPLLSDPDLTVHNAYGAYGEKMLYGKTDHRHPPLHVRRGRRRPHRAAAVQRQGHRTRRQPAQEARTRLGHPLCRRAGYAPSLGRPGQ